MLADTANDMQMRWDDGHKTNKAHIMGVYHVSTILYVKSFFDWIYNFINKNIL